MLLSAILSYTSGRKDVFFLFNFDPPTIAVITSLTALVSALAALLNVVVAWLTARFNSRAAYRLESSKLYFNAQTDAFSKLMSAAAAFRTDPSAENALQLNSALSYAVLYCSESSREVISRYGQVLISLAHDHSEQSAIKLAHAQVAAQIAMQQELSALQTIKLK